MPAKSAKQERFMRAVAENPKFAKKVDVPQSVGKEYIGKARGGSMKLCSACKSPAKCKAAGMCLAKKTATAKMGGVMKYKAGGTTKMAKGGAFAKTFSGRSGDSAEFQTERGRSMSEGMQRGRALTEEEMRSNKAIKKPAAKAKGGKMKAYKAGGKIDGCAMRGKTKGTMR